ncbi:MAG: hypothetical protein ABIW38_15660 [Ferruginibacter sp.]
MKHLPLFLLFFSVNICLSQTKWHPFVGAYASMDGGGYYAGPSFQIGTDYSLKKKNSLVTYFHYFPKKLNNSFSNGTYEYGKYRSATLALLVQVRLSKKEKKGMLLAGGAALQRTSENYLSDIEVINSKRLILVAALRIGHLFPIGNKILSLELNALGPHQSSMDTAPYISQSIELLTQLSFGARVIF